ncbi:MULTISPECIES: TetR/AcrR family transcriptional regulator [Phyllobacteriaceae]|jgi:AcrR family transcriptional regulator|uniref:TetR/AcrR family transcriptional regulator n=1 Tax=Phyllobacteriaceae TaxID=69277 RepID=UPI0009E04D0D|nr:MULTISPECIES: TetR/AcrR family transcriptional regulator [Mesorhizobium]MBN9236517.1 TetR family transcriptional regulator [Mesorhizobium sp.]MDQ0329552.1 AcrR family transcriptional regulator [Mesorhizobium sp. YL-MeA3-2017]
MAARPHLAEREEEAGAVGGTIAADGSRAAILDAAAACFMARGYAASSIDDVARSLGSTKGRIYHHYPSKGDLFADVFRTGMAMNYAAIEPARRLAGTAVEQWRHMATIHTRQMIVTRSYQRVVWEGVELYLRGATTPEQREEFARLMQVRNDYGAIFRQVIVAARQAGAMRFDDPGITEQLMFVSLNSPLFWYTPRPGETKDDIEAIVAQVVHFTARGLGVGEGNL